MKQRKHPTGAPRSSNVVWEFTGDPEDFYAALAANSASAKPYPFIDAWYPACGGSETPFKSRMGITMLYVFNPVRGEHAYLNVDSDMIMTNDEAMRAMHPDWFEVAGPTPVDKFMEKVNG